MARYRKLASDTVTDMERARLLGLLGKEMDELADFNKPWPRPPRALNRLLTGGRRVDNRA